MITKEITICGKQVTLGYCYATEIAYKAMADEDINDFVGSAVARIQEKKDPEIKGMLFFILAAIKSYYESQSKLEDGTPPVTDGDLMYNATPAEICKALGTVLSLRAEFYNIPSGEPEDTKNDGEEKNV